MHPRVCRPRVPRSEPNNIASMDFLANINVDDLDKAVRFYQAAFGLKVGRRFGADGVEMLGGPAPRRLTIGC